MSLPVVAVVGRPNVGKSTLFNRIARTRDAVVAAEPGVTRDRLARPAEWNGVRFLLVDTGGILPFGEGDQFHEAVSGVARSAIAHADLVLFVGDVRVGPTDLDQALARELRGSGKPMLVVANKSERAEDELAAAEFHALALGDVHPVSALHGTGAADLLDILVAMLPRDGREEEEADLRIALLGRPNVGKSSLLNTLVGDERVLVSDVPGTTRDAIDTRLRWHGHELLLVDTAGIRRRVKHRKDVEYFSVMRTVQAIERCDVAVLLLDATTGLVVQDQKVASLAHDAGKGLVFAVNKWDAIEKVTETARRFEEEVRYQLAFCDYAPLVTISATERQRTGKVLDLAWEVGQAREKKVETSRLNALLQKAMAKNPPKAHNNMLGKVYYATQTGTAPPTFTLFCNRANAFPRHYLRYLNNQLREGIGFPGTRIRLSLREKKR